MTENSLICKYIRTFPDTWREEFAKLDIEVKEEGNLAIFNYGIGADFHRPLVQEARGIIIELSTLTVVAWPFRKFGNYTESYADTIDWSTARVQEKLDGSILKLYYYDGIWRWATNGMINADARFAKLITKCHNYSSLEYDEAGSYWGLNKDKTYIFELTGPENQIVVSYKIPLLYHIGTRNNLTGEECNDEIGIIKPKEYPVHSFEECLSVLQELNKGSDTVEHEGFVVVDAQWNRIKVKTEEYFYAHRLFNNGDTRPEYLLDIILTGRAEATLKTLPHRTAAIRYYQWQLEELKLLIQEKIEYARSLYEEYSHERSAVARQIAFDNLSSFMFKGLDDPNYSADLAVERLGSRRLSKYIKPYERGLL